MKKFLSVIMTIILSVTLFTGCNIVRNFIPLRHNFGQYGVSFTIAGEVVEREGNKYGSASFNTRLGSLEFERFYDILSGSLLNADNMIALAAANYNATPRTLSNGASYFICNNGTNNSGKQLITLAYGIQVGAAVWMIACTTTEANFDREAIIDVCMSAEFC